MYETIICNYSISVFVISFRVISLSSTECVPNSNVIIFSKSFTKFPSLTLRKENDTFWWEAPVFLKLTFVLYSRPHGEWVIYRTEIKDRNLTEHLPDGSVRIYPQLDFWMYVGKKIKFYFSQRFNFWINKTKCRQFSISILRHVWEKMFHSVHDTQQFNVVTTDRIVFAEVAFLGYVVVVPVLDCAHFKVVLKNVILRLLQTFFFNVFIPHNES